MDVQPKNCKVLFLVNGKNVYKNDRIEAIGVLLLNGHKCCFIAMFIGFD